MTDVATAEQRVTDEGDGPAVVCLHGFPQNAMAFDQVARTLVAGGRRVVRFDQRGYGDDRLEARRAYTVARLAEDVLDVVANHNLAPCVLVGHDLGGLVAWEVARTDPSILRGLVIVSVPHPAAFLLSLLGIRQAVSSWYFALAQSTGLSTAAFSPKREASRRRLTAQLAKTGLPRAISAPYLEHLTAGDRFAAAIRWYQAMPLAPPQASFFFVDQCPVEIVWGRDDALTGELSVNLSRCFVEEDRLRITKIAGGTHWLLDDSPQVVTEAIERVLERSTGP